MIQSRIEPYTNGDFHFLGCYCFSDRERNLLLADNGCIILLEDDLVRCLEAASPSPALQFKLVQHGLAMAPGKVMFGCEKELKPEYFIIDLTKKCNFDCVYCFRDLDNADTISTDLLDDILNYITSFCNENQIRQIGLQMWGGEPIFALEHIEHVVSFFKNCSIKAAIDIETNASIISYDIAEKLFRWNIHIGVSLDGTPRLHDIQRRFRSGEPTSQQVEEGIRNLKKFYGDELGGITVVTKYNYRYIREMLDYYIVDLGLKNMKFNIVRDNANAGENALGISEDEVIVFANELLDYLQAYRMMGISFSEGNVELRAENILRRTGRSCCISHGCQGGKKIISFDQEGNIFPCEMTDFLEEKIGSIYDGANLTDQISKAVHKNRFFLPKKDVRCDGCPWWYFCQGGCSSRNRYLGRDGEIDTTECALNRTIYPRLVEWILNGDLR